MVILNQLFFFNLQIEIVTYPAMGGFPVIIVCGYEVEGRLSGHLKC